MLERKFLKASLFVILLFAQTFSFGCPLCYNPIGQAVREGILHTHFGLILGSMSFIFVFYIFIARTICHFLYFFFYQKCYINYSETDKKKLTEINHLFFSVMMLAAGIWGFLDGIIFHQILQLHSMISNILPLDTVANVEINMFWDGVFHLFSLSILLYGMMLTTKAIINTSIVRLSWSLLNSFFLGVILLGGGVFNFIEGALDHQLLVLHHVAQRFSIKTQFYSDLLFLMIAVVLMAIGVFVIRNSLKTHT